MPLLNKSVHLPDRSEPAFTGWIPPIPDMRDYTEEHKKIAPMVEALGIAAPNLQLPPTTDRRPWCSPIEDQRSLGSCTANAAVGIVEYLENRAFGKYHNGSRLFVYKTSRNLMGVVGDTGSAMRITMGALRLCGVPMAEYWPYTTVKEPGVAGERTFDDEPPPFVYAIADNFEATSYLCHDPAGSGVTPPNVLTRVKRVLAAGVPSMFGFYGLDLRHRSNLI